MYVYLIHRCITAVQCNSSTTAEQYTTYYCYTAAVFAVCTYIARPPPLLLVIHGYTQQYQVLLLIILYLTWLLCITFCSPLYVWYTATGICYFLACPPSLARRHFVGYTWLYTAVPGTINTVPYLVAVCINTTCCSPLYVWYTATGMYYFLACPQSLARCRSCWLYTAVHFCWYISSSTSWGDLWIKNEILCTPTTLLPTRTYSFHYYFKYI